jgi:hypothetical protein
MQPALLIALAAVAFIVLTRRTAIVWRAGRRWPAVFPLAAVFITPIIYSVYCEPDCGCTRAVVAVGCAVVCVVGWALAVATVPRTQDDEEPPPGER